MTVSEQIDQFIAENGGNARYALNVALARLEIAQKEIEFLKESEQETVNTFARILNNQYSCDDNLPDSQ